MKMSPNVPWENDSMVCSQRHTAGGIPDRPDTGSSEQILRFESDTAATPPTLAAGNGTSIHMGDSLSRKSEPQVQILTF